MAERWLGRRLTGWHQGQGSLPCGDDGGPEPPCFRPMVCPSSCALVPACSLATASDAPGAYRNCLGTEIVMSGPYTVEIPVPKWKSPKLWPSSCMSVPAQTDPDDVAPPETWRPNLLS